MVDGSVLAELLRIRFHGTILKLSDFQDFLLLAFLHLYPLFSGCFSLAAATARRSRSKQLRPSVIYGIPMRQSDKQILYTTITTTAISLLRLLLCLRSSSISFCFWWPFVL